MPTGVGAAVAGSLAGAVAGKVLGGGKGGGGGSTTVQQKEMPSWLSQDWQDLVTQAQGVNQQPFAPYTGQAVAPLSGDESTAFQSLRDLMGSSDAAFGGAQSTLQDVIGRAVNGPSAGQIQGLMNPYTQNVLEQQNLMTLQNYDRTMGGLKSQAVNAGGFGGSGDYIRRAMASKDLGQQLASNNATGLSNAYNQAMGQWNANTGTMAQGALSQANLASQLQGLNTSGANSLANAGATQRGIGQQQNAFDLSEFMRQQNYGKDQANFLSNILGQASPGFSGTTTHFQNNPNQMNSILGGGIAGSQLGSAFGNYGTQQGWWGPNSNSNLAASQNAFSLYNTQQDVMDSVYNPNNSSFFSKGGLIKKYAEGGLVKGYAGGGFVEQLKNFYNTYVVPGGMGQHYAQRTYPTASPTTPDSSAFSLPPAGSDAYKWWDDNSLSTLDPVEEHRRAVMAQEAQTGTSKGQRQDLALGLPLEGIDPIDNSLDGSMVSNALSDAGATANAPVLGQAGTAQAKPIGTQDSSSMLNELINKTIQEKVAAANKPKTFAEEANTPLLAMGLSMMGSNSPSFGGALNEGYKAFQGATSAAEADKAKQLKDLLDMAETQRKNTSQGFEDQLRQAQTKEALARAAVAGGNKPMSPNAKIASLARVMGEELAGVKKMKENPLMYQPEDIKAAEEAATAKGLARWKMMIEASGQDTSGIGSAELKAAKDAAVSGVPINDPLAQVKEALALQPTKRAAILKAATAQGLDVSGL